jgi:ribosomal-protein-alanine N-acetyltransferase
MTRIDADAILAWHYEEPYNFYDQSFDPSDTDGFTDPRYWRMRELEDLEVVVAVKDQTGELEGFFAFGGSPDLCTIGLGLAPELTGRSLGTELDLRNTCAIRYASHS